MADPDSVVLQPLTENALELYKSLFDHHPDAIYALDLVGTIFIVNSSAELLFGYTLNQLQTLPFTQLFQEADREKVVDFFEQTLQGNSHEYEATLLHQEGQAIVTQVTHVPIVMQGRTVGSYLMIKDITERKRLEAERLLVEEALRASEMRLRIIEDNVSDLIAIADVRTAHSEYVSPSHETVLGFSREYILSSPYTEHYHPDDLPWVNQMCYDMVKYKKPINGEYRRLHADGHWVIMEGKAFPVRGEDGEVEKILVVARDISERKRTEELLVQSEKLSIAGHLAAGIAHEIRNPLTAIKGFLQIMKQNKLENITYLNLMLDEMDRIEVILSELLVLAKPQATPFVSQYLTAILQDVLMLINSEALLHNIQIELNIECELPKVHCDQNQLKQMFLNFLKNAIEAMEDGGTIKIEVRKSDDESQVQVRIIDEGCGISEEIVSRLGEPFYATKEKGTGLGMMVCKRIIETHNGAMHVSSRLHEGTTIEVLLPLESELVV
ncbi:MAG: PAS domain-containing sensor histidine kinase [Tumebacillaceae bacterium]